jgi:hypothetical protein
MEHRHFTRKQLQLAVQLMASNGRVYQAQVLDMSAIGMRVVTNNILPAREKVVDILLPESIDPDDQLGPTYRLRMFVAHKSGRELGLCLVNEGMKIDLDSPRLDDALFSSMRKVAGY